MATGDDVEDALRLAVDRTRDAQSHVSDELERDRIPDDASAETVVERADDVTVLADEAGRPRRNAPSQEPPKR